MEVCGRLCDSGEAVTLAITGGRISAWKPGAAPGALGGADIWLAPGFCDLQVNGYAGVAFNQDPAGDLDSAAESLLPVLAASARAGAPLLCPTLTTDSVERLEAGLRAIVRLIEVDAGAAAAIVGIHVEGPFIAPEDGPRGAHPIEHVREPSWEIFQRLQEAAGGRIAILTLAPERPGALELIERVAESGVVVAIGHTASPPERIAEAALAGARMATHLGNGAHSQIRRHPNYIWEQMANDSLFAGMIADGHHLPPSVLKCMIRVKGPGRVALVSDVVALGGMPPGIYDDGRHEVLPSGKVVLAGTPYLAGAGHLMDTCVANAMRYTDLTLAQSVHCAAAVPARILGREARKGSIRVGADADLTLFRVREEGPLEIVATVRAGAIAWSAGVPHDS